MLMALMLAAAAPAPLDPAVLTSVSLDTIEWTQMNGSSVKMLAGDLSKPGIYVLLIKWRPGQMSRPHYHPRARYITVLKGTWWVGTGPHFDPDHMVPMPAGSIVTHKAGGIHYDGSRDGETIIQIVGEGPSTTTPAEAKPSP